MENAVTPAAVWGAIVPTYYLYLLDRADHVRRRLDLDCRDDVHAIEVVEEHDRSLTMELWEGSRMVKRFEIEAE